MSWPRSAQFNGGMRCYELYGDALILRNRKSQPRRSRFAERRRGSHPARAAANTKKKGGSALANRY